MDTVNKYPEVDRYSPIDDFLSTHIVYTTSEFGTPLKLIRERFNELYPDFEVSAQRFANLLRKRNLILKHKNKGSFAEGIMLKPIFEDRGLPASDPL